MKMRRIFFLFSVVLMGVSSGALTGCATSETVQNASLQEAQSRTFDATYERTKVATLKALSSMNVSITKSSEDTTSATYLVSKSMTAFSWGEVGRVLIRKSESAPTTVYVNWEKRYQPQITGTDQNEFSNSLFAQIQKVL